MPLIKTQEQVDQAKLLVLEGKLLYQPFAIAEDLSVGAGYEFIRGELSGCAYWPTIPLENQQSPQLMRWIVDPARKKQFVDANRRLAVLYDGFIDGICRHLGDISQLTFADVGCNAGYFPVSFLKRGAKQAVGFDREDYHKTFAWINAVLNTGAEFVHKGYDGKHQCIPDAGQFDVVVSVAVLCHLSDTLQHLAALGGMAKKALFIWTPVTTDDDYCIRFGEPNKYYGADSFPLCFDNRVRPSAKLLRKSLELMGFSQIVEFANPPNGMPKSFFKAHAAILAMRP
jgi:hypothetical protein